MILTFCIIFPMELYHKYLGRAMLDVVINRIVTTRNYSADFFMKILTTRLERAIIALDIYLFVYNDTIERGFQ